MRRIEEEEVEGEIVEQWSIKRVFIGIFIFLAIFSIGWVYIWENHIEPTVLKVQNVLGASVESPPPVELPNKKDAEEILRNAQKELLQIAPENVVTSGEALTKIINDLESLREGSSKPTDMICKFVCK